MVLWGRKKRSASDKAAARQSTGHVFVVQPTGHFLSGKIQVTFVNYFSKGRLLLKRLLQKATSFLSPKQHPFFFCQPTVTLPLNKSPFAISYFSSRLITANSFLNPTHSQLSTTFLRNSFGPLPERRNSTWEQNTTEIVHLDTGLDDATRQPNVSPSNSHLFFSPQKVSFFEPHLKLLTSD